MLKSLVLIISLITTMNGKIVANNNKKNVWIGANSIILPGVNIGENCIIGAGSVVTKSFKDNCLIGGKILPN